jgi:RNA polymerase sigma-70 factor (ECF subfamily)
MAERGGFVDIAEVNLATLCPTPSQVVAQDERQRRFLAGLRELPSEAQSLLELHYWDGQTTAEMAEIVGVPVGTVRTRLDRARELLRRQLAAADFDASRWLRLEG